MSSISEVFRDKNPAISRDKNSGPPDDVFAVGLETQRRCRDFTRDKLWTDANACVDIKENVFEAYRVLKEALTGECKFLHSHRCSRAMDLLGEIETLYRDIERSCYRTNGSGAVSADKFSFLKIPRFQWYKSGSTDYT